MSFPKILLDVIPLADRCSTYNTTVLHAAIKHGYIWQVKTLLERGVDVDAATCLGKQTPLHSAVYEQSSEIVRLLLTYGADLLRLDNRGCAPLESSTSARVMQVVAEYFISREAAGYRVDWFHHKLTKLDRWDDEAYRQTCVEEVETMKKSRMTTDYTYYDLLKGNRKRLVRIVKDLDVVSHCVLLFEVDYLTMRFPVYSEFLKRNYILGKRYEPLLKRATFSANYMFGKQLPSIPLEHILDYLDYADMENLIKAVGVFRKDKYTEEESDDEEPASEESAPVVRIEIDGVLFFHQRCFIP